MGTKRMGRPPLQNEPAKRRATTVIKESTYDAIALYAKEHRRSVSEIIRFTLEERFDKKG